MLVVLGAAYDQILVQKLNGFEFLPQLEQFGSYHILWITEHKPKDPLWEAIT